VPPLHLPLLPPSHPPFLPHLRAAVDKPCDRLGKKDGRWEGIKATQVARGFSGLSDEKGEKRGDEDE